MLDASRGLTGSVMDYPAINVAPPGGQQGLFYMMKPGPYDVWVIQYGYQPSQANPAQEKARLEKLLARSSEPELAFGNDADDMRSAGKAVDPRVMIYDLSGDAISYAEGRIQLARQTMAKIKETIPDEGDSYQAMAMRFLLIREHHHSRLPPVMWEAFMLIDLPRTRRSNAAFKPVSREDQERAMRLRV